MSSGCQNLNYNFSFGISYFKDIKKLRNKKNVVQGIEKEVYIVEHRFTTTSCMK